MCFHSDEKARGKIHEYKGCLLTSRLHYNTLKHSIVSNPSQVCLSDYTKKPDVTLSDVTHVDCVFVLTLDL